MGPLFIVLLAFAAAVSAQDKPAQDKPAQDGETPTFRTSVAVVKVDAEVTDRGRRVPDLTKQDFVVYDDGRPQPVVFFAHESEPLDLLLLLDVSGSMSRSLEQLASAAESALRQLHAGDRAGVMLFARDARIHQPLTPDLAQAVAGVRSAVHDNSLGSGTALNAAIVAAAQYLREHGSNARRAILAVTDNLSLNYQVPDEQVIRALLQSDAVLDGILIGKLKKPRDLKPGAYANPDFTPSDLFKLTAQSGGAAVESARAGDALAQAIESIRGRYSLQYNSPASTGGAFHRITVELSPGARSRYPEAVVHARTGYYAAP